MLLCPVYCSTINPIRLQHHLGKAMVCKLAWFPPRCSCSLLGGRVMVTSMCLCTFPRPCCFGSKAGYSIPGVSCLDGGLRWLRFPTMHLVVLLTAGTAHITLHFSSPHIFSRLLSFQLYACKGGSASIFSVCTTLLFCVLNPDLSGSNGNK